MASNGIFCLEGDWGALNDRTSVRLGLDMLMTVRGGRLIHRNAATKEEFAYYLDRWSLQQYRAFPLAYFSYHGYRGALDLGKDEVTFADLASMVKRSLEGRVLYFAACETLSIPRDELIGLVRATGAKAIVGYTKRVDWEEQAAFDFTLLPAILDSIDLKKLYARLLKRHPYFVEGLGLRMATRTWSTTD